MKVKYEFLHRGDDGRLYWESVGRISLDESRHEVVHCSAEWFWAGRVNPSGEMKERNPIPELEG